MKALVVSSYPLVDALEYKEALLQGLADRGVETRLAYSGISARDYYREARKRGVFAEVKRLAPRPRREGNQRRGSGRRLVSIARSLDVATVSFRSLVDPACISYLESFQPDLVLNVSTLYVPDPFLAAANRRVVGAHYGDLPRLRGLDMIRWSVLLDHPLVVTHMLLAKEFDLGPIVAKTTVEVRRGDTVAVLRSRCQHASAVGHLKVVDKIREGQLEPIAQLREEGSTFSRMGRFLRIRVDTILREERYSHYRESANVT